MTDEFAILIHEGPVLSVGATSQEVYAAACAVRPDLPPPIEYLYGRQFDPGDVVLCRADAYFAEYFRRYGQPQMAVLGRDGTLHLPKFEREAIESRVDSGPPVQPECG